MPHSDALGMSSAGKQNGSPGFESALQDAATDARARISQTLQELAGLGSSLEGPFGFMISVVLPGENPNTATCTILYRPQSAEQALARYQCINFSTVRRFGPWPPTSSAHVFRVSVPTGLSRSCTADGSVEHHEGGIARVHHEQDPALGPTEVVRAQAENILRYHAQEWASRQEPPVRLPNISVDGTDVERMHEGPLGDAGMMQHMMGVPPGLEGSDHLQCRDIPAGARDAAMIPAMGMGAGGVGGGMDPGMAAWSGPMDPGWVLWDG